MLFKPLKVLVVLKARQQLWINTDKMEVLRRGNERICILKLYFFLFSLNSFYRLIARLTGGILESKRYVNQGCPFLFLEGHYPAVFYASPLQHT